ncbi:hypothetical protein MMC21_004125 [Puttea exsequens]|nr:hypothetical protein [Puttea exsequens]
MAPAKRKADASGAVSSSHAKRIKKEVEKTASSSRPSRISLAAANVPRPTRNSVSGASSPVNNGARGRPSLSNGVGTKSIAKSKLTKKANLSKPSKKNQNSRSAQNSHGNSIFSVSVPDKSINGAAEDNYEDDEKNDEPSYWLMKAEPDSRIEKGKDVKFSIDDLKLAKEPEAWDGVRNHVAKNNMRLMMKGDLAFFYHSNCKIPGIVGTMEIVQEHSVDESAFDPEHPYYDEKSARENPKWCVVHVAFRQKFQDIIKLKELQKYAKEGGVLENMQTLKTTRLSVSKVSKQEWDFIMGLAEVEEESAADAAVANAAAADQGLETEAKVEA